jgi:hypothetical protein
MNICKKYCLVALVWQSFSVGVAFAGCATVADATLGGAAASTLSGTYTIRKGMLALAKPDGVTAIAGNIIVGGGTDQAILRWDANHQVVDTASITLLGPYPARLRMDGHSETMGALVLAGDGDISLGDDTAVVRFANSSAQAWTTGKRFLILDWNGSLTGGGSEAVFFGSSANGLTTAQLAQVSFINPAGFDPGTYPAALLVTGEVVPATASAFDIWIGAAGKGLTGVSAVFDADPDHDAIPNGIEFVLGSEPNPNNPGCNSSALLPTAASVGNNLVFTFTRSHEAAYLNPFVEFTADLQGAWTTAVDPGNATISVTPGNPSEIVTVSIPQGSNKKMFARLKVVTTP